MTHAHAHHYIFPTSCAQASASRLSSTQLPQWLLSEQISAAANGLGEYHRQVTLLAELREARARLAARSRAFTALGALLRELSHSAAPAAAVNADGIAPSGGDGAAAAGEALASALATLSPELDSTARHTDLAALAVSALLKLEEMALAERSPSCEGKSLADALAMHAADVHEVMSVLALALDPPPGPSSCAPATAASAREVRISDTGEERIFVLVDGSEGKRVLYPNGW